MSEREGREWAQPRLPGLSAPAPYEDPAATEAAAGPPGPSQSSHHPLMKYATMIKIQTNFSSDIAGSSVRGSHAGGQRAPPSLGRLGLPRDGGAGGSAAARRLPPPLPKPPGQRRTPTGGGRRLAPCGG